MIDEIFNCISSRSCGLCCSESSPCDNCTSAILAQNGLPPELFSEIKGLKHRAPSYGNGFEYSELHMKLRELIKKNRKL